MATLSASIAAASILAKVERDRMVSEWDPVFPVRASVE
jgi:ribonuclease HII